MIKLVGGRVKLRHLRDEGGSICIAHEEGEESIHLRHFRRVCARIDGEGGALLFEMCRVGDCCELWRRKPVAERLKRFNRGFAVVHDQSVTKT